MKKEDLELKNPLYEANIEEWNRYGMTYDGGAPFIKYALYRYSNLESEMNFNERVRNGYVFNYAQSIVDLYNFYLTEKPAVRKLGALEENPQFNMFLRDSDLNNTDFHDFMKESQKISSVHGSLGILVNKPDGFANDVYPYVTRYSLPNILDWTIVRDERTHRSVLTYLKLLEEDDTYLLMWPDRWEKWEIVKKTKQPKMLGQGSITIEEIPFIWMPNLKRIENWYLGVSDIVDISRIVESIVRNLSHGEEIIKLAGFPMLRKPMEKAFGIEEKDDDNKVPIGVRAVQEFDASLGESGKPDWMPTEIYEPIEAVLKWIDRKAEESYRIAHLSGVHGQRTSGEPASGLALRYSLQQLYSVLEKKSKNMTEAEMQIIRLWMKWQRMADKFSQINITRPKEFSIDDLAVELDNAFTSMRNMASKTFRTKLQMKVADHILPDLTEEERVTIEKETESNTPVRIELFKDTFRNQTGGGKEIRPADQTSTRGRR